jgi:hypothetical protein
MDTDEQAAATYQFAIGRQGDAGFAITHMYEDYMLDSLLHNYHPNYVATRALKMKFIR